MIDDFEIFVLASEVKSDLGGQRSLNKMCGELTKKVAYKIWSSYLYRFLSYMHCSPTYGRTVGRTDGRTERKTRVIEGAPLLKNDDI